LIEENSSAIFPLHRDTRKVRQVTVPLSTVATIHPTAVRIAGLVSVYSARPLGEQVPADASALDTFFGPVSSIKMMEDSPPHSGNTLVLLVMPNTESARLSAAENAISGCKIERHSGSYSNYIYAIGAK
jgi:hypothetical protein